MIPNRPDAITCGGGKIFYAKWFDKTTSSIVEKKTEYVYGLVTYRYNWPGKAVDIHFKDDSEGTFKERLGSKADYTKFDGWPDVIICGINYHYFNKLDDKLIMYSSPRFSEDRSNIIFESDGKFKSVESNSSISDECKDKSIDWYFTNKKALTIVKSKVRTKEESILENFPDAIKCGKKDNIFYLSKTNPDNTVLYKKLEHDKEGIIFNADRSYKGPEPAAVKEASKEEEKKDEEKKEEEKPMEEKKEEEKPMGEKPMGGGRQRRNRLLNEELKERL